MLILVLYVQEFEEICHNEAYSRWNKIKKMSSSNVEKGVGAIVPCLTVIAFWTKCQLYDPLLMEQKLQLFNLKIFFHEFSLHPLVFSGRYSTRAVQKNKADLFYSEFTQSFVLDKTEHGGKFCVNRTLLELLGQISQILFEALSDKYFS